MCLKGDLKNDSSLKNNTSSSILFFCINNSSETFSREKRYSLNILSWHWRVFGLKIKQWEILRNFWYNVQFQTLEVNTTLLCGQVDIWPIFYLNICPLLIWYVLYSLYHSNGNLDIRKKKYFIEQDTLIIR